MADSYNFSNAAYRRKIRTHSIIRFIVCVLLTIICLLPIYIILINSTRDNAEIIQNGISLLPGTNFIQNFKNLTDPEYAHGVYFRTFNLLIGYRNSLIIAGSTTILTVFFSAMTAYGLTVYDFKGKKFATTFILRVMMVPTQVVSTGFLEFMASIKLLNNYVPLILPAIAAPGAAGGGGLRRLPVPEGREDEAGPPGEPFRLLSCGALGGDAPAAAHQHGLVPPALPPGERHVRPLVRGQLRFRAGAGSRGGEPLQPAALPALRRPLPALPAGGDLAADGADGAWAMSGH